MYIFIRSCETRPYIIYNLFRQLLKTSNSQKQHRNKRMTTLKESKEIDDDPEDTGITIKVSESAYFFVSYLGKN